MKILVISENAHLIDVSLIEKTLSLRTPLTNGDVANTETEVLAFLNREILGGVRVLMTSFIPQDIEAFDVVFNNLGNTLTLVHASLDDIACAASRYNGIKSSPIRVLGSAKLDDPHSQYAHIGMELWTGCADLQTSMYAPSEEVNTKLDTYADKCVEWCNANRNELIESLVGNELPIGIVVHTDDLRAVPVGDRRLRECALFDGNKVNVLSCSVNASVLAGEIPVFIGGGSKTKFNGVRAIVDVAADGIYSDVRLTEKEKDLVAFLYRYATLNTPEVPKSRPLPMPLFTDGFVIYVSGDQTNVPKLVDLLESNEIDEVVNVDANVNPVALLKALRFVDRRIVVLITKGISSVFDKTADYARDIIYMDAEGTFVISNAPKFKRRTVNSYEACKLLSDLKLNTREDLEEEMKLATTMEELLELAVMEVWLEKTVTVFIPETLKDEAIETLTAKGYSVKYKAVPQDGTMTHALDINLVLDWSDSVAVICDDSRPKKGTK